MRRAYGRCRARGAARCTPVCLDWFDDARDAARLWEQIAGAAPAALVAAVRAYYRRDGTFAARRAAHAAAGNSTGADELGALRRAARALDAGDAPPPGAHGQRLGSLPWAALCRQPAPAALAGPA